MRTLATLFLLAPLTSCAWLHKAVTPVRTIDAQTAGPLILDVCDQHDESVARDSVLVDAEKDQALRSTELLRAMVTAAMESPVQ